MFITIFTTEVCSILLDLSRCVMFTRFFKVKKMAKMHELPGSADDISTIWVYISAHSLHPFLGSSCTMRIHVEQSIKGLSHIFQKSHLDFRGKVILCFSHVILISCEKEKNKTKRIFSRFNKFLRSSLRIT
jgi:hypothetical protein